MLGTGNRNTLRGESRQRKEVGRHHSLVCLPPRGWEDLTNGSVSPKQYQDMVRTRLNDYRGVGGTGGRVKTGFEIAITVTTKTYLTVSTD